MECVLERNYANFELMHTGIEPCPLELSSYMEASYSCIPSKSLITFQIFCVLQSYADGICSGRPTCVLHVSDLLKTNIKPCPLELSSYLEASYACINGKKVMSSLSICKAMQMENVLESPLVSSMLVSCL